VLQVAPNHTPLFYKWKILNFISYFSLSPFSNKPLLSCKISRNPTHRFTTDPTHNGKPRGNSATPSRPLSQAIPLDSPRRPRHREGPLEGGGFDHYQIRR